MTNQKKDPAEDLKIEKLKDLEDNVLDEDKLHSYVGSALSAGNDPSDIYAAIRDGLEKKLSPLRIQAEGSRSTQEALKIEKSSEYRKLEYLLKVASKRNIPIYKIELHASNDPKYVSAKLMELFEEEVRQARGIGGTRYEDSPS